MVLSFTETSPFELRVSPPIELFFLIMLPVFKDIILESIFSLININIWDVGI